MIVRGIEIFDKIKEDYIGFIQLNVSFETLSKKYYNELRYDPELCYDYEITINDEIFYKNIINYNFEFDKYSYYLTCYNSNEKTKLQL